MQSAEFTQFVQSKDVVILDGATGTNLQQRGLPAGMAPEKWVLDHPEKILALQSDFVASGSDIILTCTFGGTRSRLAHSGLETRVEEVNLRAIDLARQATAGTSVLVAGSMGPSGEMMDPYGTLTADAAFTIFRQQAEALLNGGVDLIVVETQFDLNEARAALDAIRSLSDAIAVVCSFSYDRGKRTMMGLKPATVAEFLHTSAVQAIGVNCGKSLETNLEVLQELTALTELPIWFKPNAGAPTVDESGQAHYTISPKEMGTQAKIWAANGAKLIGGCCGTSPAHLAEIKLAVGPSSSSG